MKHLAQKLPLTVPVYQILLTLSDRALHGYAIIQDIRARTGGEVDLTASTMYAAVGRMLDAGLIAEVESRPDADGDDARRRTYRIEVDGRELLRLEALRLERSAQMARDKSVIPALAESRSGGKRS
jgi:DNA-binding PadR family transcriptional regulator